VQRRRSGQSSDPSTVFKCSRALTNDPFVGILPSFLMLEIAGVSCFEFRRLFGNLRERTFSKVARMSCLQSRDRNCAPPQTCFSPRTARAHGRRSLHCRRSIGNSPFHGLKPASLASATALERTVVFYLCLGPYQPHVACASSRATSNGNEGAD
jgi:hypothetical protein